MLSFYCFFLLLFFVIPSKIKEICNSKLTFFRVQRRKREMPISNIENLPPELVSNILSRLPAKDLFICKRVSKSWFHLISDSHFISNYYFFYNNLNNQEECQRLLVIRRPFFSSLKTYISLLSANPNETKGHVNNSSSSHLLNPPCEYNSEHKYWSEIMGPCNGIYFLEGNPNVIMNPSLRQFKALPESHLSDSHDTYSLTNYSGFGFDPKTNDYKVVTIKDVWLRETDERKIGHWTAELYSLNSNSWRKIEAALPLPFEIWGSSRVYTYVNNCFHWGGYYVDEDGRKQDIVVAFDMVNEVFRKISVPKIRDSSKEVIATLVPFEECSTIGVIVVYPVRETEKRFDVWVMKDYWDEGSWIKQYSVGAMDQMIHKLVGFCGNSQFVWNDESQKTKDVKVYGKCDSLRAVRYMESLVSIERGNEFNRQLVSCDLVQDHLLNQKGLSVCL